MEAVELLDRAAVEHDVLPALAAQPVQLLGGDVRRVALDLDDLGKGLAGHVGAREQRMPGRRPRRDTAVEDMDRGIAERRQPARRLGGDAVAVVEQHDPAVPARHQPRHHQLQPAIGGVHRKQRMAVAVLPLLAHVEKRDLAAIAKPAPQGRDINGGGGCRRAGHGLRFPGEYGGKPPPQPSPACWGGRSCTGRHQALPCLREREGPAPAGTGGWGLFSVTAWRPSGFRRRSARWRRRSRGRCGRAARARTASGRRRGPAPGWPAAAAGCRT